MNNTEIKNWRPVFNDYEESYFTVELVGGKSMEIPMWSFYSFLSEIDGKLSEYGGKFPEWEKLTEDLIELGYDFKSPIKEYVNQFTPEELNEFTFNDEDFEDDEDFF